jgi:hypothetical protein
MPRIKCKCGEVAVFTDAEIRREAGKNLRCLQCGRVAKIPPPVRPMQASPPPAAEQLPPVVVEEKTAVGPEIDTKRPPKKRRHPVKTLMLLATLLCPVALIIFTAAFAYMDIDSKELIGDGGFINLLTEQTSLLTLIVISAAFQALSLTMWLYVITIGFLFVVWFATKPDSP